jgi:hypothetical protein
LTGQLNEVFFYLSCGFDIHHRDDYAVRESFRSDLKVMQSLIEKGADIHAKEDILYYDSAFYGKLDHLEYLLGLCDLSDVKLSGLIQFLEKSLMESSNCIRIGLLSKSILYLRTHQRQIRNRMIACRHMSKEFNVPQELNSIIDKYIYS